MNKTVYLCGPITGLTYDQATEEREELVRRFAEHKVEALSPMRGKIFFLENRAQIIEAKGYDNVIATDKAIINRDRNDVKSCGAMVADLRGCKRVSIGSMVEFGWADAYRIPIITVMTEGFSDDPHDHAFVHGLSTYVVHDMEEAILLTLTLLNAR